MDNICRTKYVSRQRSRLKRWASAHGYYYFALATQSTIMSVKAVLGHAGQTYIK